MKYLPNILTLSRILLTFLFIYFVSQSSLISILLATFIFTLASLTDYYDGHIAKKMNVKSNFGTIMDPLADKFLILAAFFIFVQARLMESWMFSIIFAREIFITAIRVVAMVKGRFLGAEKSGKIKTVIQMITIWLVLLTIIFKAAGLMSSWSWGIILAWSWLLMFSMWLTVAITLVSGVIYLLHNWKLFLR